MFLNVGGRFWSKKEKMNDYLQYLTANSTFRQNNCCFWNMCRTVIFVILQRKNMFYNIVLSSLANEIVNIV